MQPVETRRLTTKEGNIDLSVTCRRSFRLSEENLSLLPCPPCFSQVVATVDSEPALIEFISVGYLLGGTCCF